MDIDIPLSDGVFLEASSAIRPLLRLIPHASLMRLPQYHHYLADLEAKGITQISCSSIGRDLGCIPVVVRKDLQFTGITGRPKTGYSVSELVQTIEKFLGWNKVNEAFLVGAGNLGTALLGHQRFSKFGLRIAAAFDSDKKKIGRHIHKKMVVSLDLFDELARTLNIRLGIITTSAEAAQSVADLMVAAGIQAIWNFAPVRLQVPEQVFVHNEDLYASLASLSWKLTERLRVPLQ